MRGVYIVSPSVLSCGNLKLHRTLEAKNTLKHEKIVLQLTLNPVLTLTGFQTARPGNENLTKIAQFDFQEHLA